MDTRQLKTFSHLAKTLNFSKTAEELHYAQSTVSAQIRSLENELKLTLFDRLGKKVVLTNEGKSVLHYANRFMVIEDEFITSLKAENTVSGELNIFAPNSVCVYHLPCVLTDFREKHPDVCFVLRAHHGTKNALKELRSGAIDLMIVIEEKFTDPDFNVITLKPEEIILVCHNDHPKAGQENVSLDDLKNENFILTEPTCGYRAILTREFLDMGHKLNPVMWFDNAEAIKECIKCNMGISFLPKISAQCDLDQGKLSQIHLEKDYNEQIYLQFITHKDKWISPPLRHFMDALKEEFGCD